MGNTVVSGVQDRVPEGYRAVALHETGPNTPLRLCILARTSPDPVGGSLVQVRELLDARVFLGCVIDAGGQVSDWVEIWIQDLDRLTPSIGGMQERLTNRVLDQRWEEQYRAARDLNSDHLLLNGWEEQAGSPLFIDPVKWEAVSPADPATGCPWKLCEDEAALKAAKLPSYEATLTRYLYCPIKGGPPRFIQVSKAGESEASLEQLLPQLFPDNKQYIPVNPQGGRVLVFKYCPLSFEETVDLLSGKSWEAGIPGKAGFDFGECYQQLTQLGNGENTAGFLFLSGQGKAGRLAEVFHLKLTLLAQVFRLVRGQVAKRGLPLLNIAPDTFRCRLSDVAGELPFLWTAKCHLVRPGQAVAMSLPGTDQSYFVRQGKPGPAIYQPDRLAAPTSGSGTVRIRQVTPQPQGGTVIEGTLESTADTPQVGSGNLLWLRLPFPNTRVSLYAHVEDDESATAGEVRFKTLPQKLPDKVQAALVSEEVFSFSNVPFEVLPCASSPCDLYALAILAVRTLLYDGKTQMRLLIDELHRLARQALQEHSSGLPLSRRLQTVCEKDSRWLTPLGPQRLCRSDASPAQALEWVPPELWFQALGLLIRLLPGRGPDSICQHLGDVEPSAPERVFDVALAELDELILRTRSLLFADWSFNREINSVIKELLEKAEP